jgi:hypothetical protein
MRRGTLSYPLVMRRTWAAVLLVVAGLSGLAGCGGDDDGGSDGSAQDTAAPTTVAPTTSTEGDGVHFDPGVEEEAQQDAEPDDDPCTEDSSNEGAIIGDRIDCALPHLADLVGATSMYGQDGHLDVIVSGQLDVAQALEVCEVATAVIATELTSWSDVRLTITADPTVVFGQPPTAIVTATGPGTCAPA